jgi:AcrR family transcriptional regulator
MEIFDLSKTGLPEKEQKILESAVNIFSEKGFSAATTSEIAKNAGVAEGTIFRYFKTKKDILRGILIQTINIMSSKLVLGSLEKIFDSGNEKDIRVVLKELFYDRIKLVENIFPMLRVILTEALYHEDVRQAIYENIITRGIDLFSDFHRSMAERGMLRNDVKPEIIFRSLLGNGFMFIAQRMLFGDKFQFDDLDTELDRIIDVVLYGIAPEKNV